MSKARSVLGKGLGALIPGAGDNQSVHEDDNFQSFSDAQSIGDRTAPIDRIDITLIEPNPLQPRRDFPKESLQELSQSILEHGIIQPITVRKLGPDRYQLVSGERRVRASIEAGLTEIPAYVIAVETDRKMLELAIIENVQRLQLNPIEEAEAYQRLIEECDLTQEEVAEKIAKDRSTVTNFLRLLKLPMAIRESLRQGDLGIGHAKAVMSVPTEEKQVELWNMAVKQHLSVRRLEELARTAVREHAFVGDEHPKSSAPKKEMASTMSEHTSPVGVIPYENALKQQLGTQVRIRVKADGSGELAVQFYSYDDLERIHDLLMTVRSDI